jgi:AcrR family transcriptional regulator
VVQIHPELKAQEVPDAPYDPAVVAEPLELPQVRAPRAERVDAMRNRAAILAAANRLLRDVGVEAITMDKLACEAGVGKGTLFRRFGSRAALATAVLSENEAELQEGFIRGEPPLGPGAPPRERLVAFGCARLDLLEAHAELIAAAEVAGAHHDSEPYAASRLHVSLLLREIDPLCDAELLADTLMASLSAGLFLYQRQVRQASLERLKAAWRALVEGLLMAEQAQPV